MRLDLGTPVECTDQPFGALHDVVIDPISRRVTHLVVGPAHDPAATRLVPIDLADRADDGAAAIRLRCTVDEAAELEAVHEYAYLRLGEAPPDDPDWDVGVSEVLAMPYYESPEFMGYGAEFASEMGMTYDRVPKGEVEIRRSSEVVSADGSHLGHVEGFLVDEEQHITHFVLEHGHLWGKRDVTIPIGAAAEVGNDAVTVSLSRSEVGNLPSVRVHRWH